MRRGRRPRRNSDTPTRPATRPKLARSHDNGNRLLSETQRIVNYAYDAANRKTQVTYPDASVINRGYTERNQLSSVKVGSTLVASRTYDAGLRLTQTTFGNGLTEDRTYRADNQVASISISTPGINVLGYQYVLRTSL